MSDYLPQEVLFDIFRRLPVKDLLHLRCVCKHWNSIISNPTFIASHTNNSDHTQTLLLRYFSEKDRFSKEHYLLLNESQTSSVQIQELQFPFRPRTRYPFRIVGSCNGLICFSDDHGTYPFSIILWNPSIRKFKALPRPRVTDLTHGNHTCFFGFGFDCKNNDYKLVRLAYVRGRNGRDLIPPEVEVYGLNSGSWRSFNAGAPPYGIADTMFTLSQAFVNGAVHWIGYDPCMAKEDLHNKLIVSFDVGDEVFREVMLPNCLVQCKEDMYLVEYGELLALFEVERYRKEVSFNMWVMKVYGLVESWTQLYSIDACEGLNRPLGFLENGEVLFATVRGKLVSYNHNNIGTKGLGIRGAADSFYVGNYMESLVLLDGKNAVLGDDAITCDGGEEHEEVPQWRGADRYS